MQQTDMPDFDTTIARLASSAQQALTDTTKILSVGRSIVLFSWDGDRYVTGHGCSRKKGVEKGGLEYGGLAR